MENTNIVPPDAPKKLKIERHEFECGDHIEFLVPDNSINKIEDPMPTKNNK